MKRISILTNDPSTGQCLTGWVRQFCEERQQYPVITTHMDTENFWQGVDRSSPDGVIVALPSVAGLNAVEHLRSLLPHCGLIWCSDLDFSLHAFRIQADYFSLAPPGREDIRNGLARMIDGKRERMI